MQTVHREILVNGLWTNNQALVAMLGLCPLLAVSNNVINGLGLGLATTLALTASNGIVAAIRHIVGKDIRLPVYVLVIASVVTVIELLMHAYVTDLYRILGIFIPLIVTNCSLVGRAEAYASRNPVHRAALDGLAMGLGFTAVLVVLGGLRELIGQGTLLSQAHLMLGDWARALKLTVFADYEGFLLAILPPGAFIGLGFLVAAKNQIDARRRRTAERMPTAAPAVSE